MSKNGVSLNWGGFDRIMARAGGRLANHHALLDSVGEALVSGTIQRFEKEEGPDGAKWPQSKRAAAQGGKTLANTSHLRGSIGKKTTKTSVMVGSNVPYARIHQMGGNTGRGRRTRMPRRPYLGVSKADMDEVRATLEDFLAGAFKA